MAGIVVKGIAETIAELKKAGGRETTEAGLQAAAVYVKGKIATYPPQTHAPQPFKTDKQRRFFFAALRRGQIQAGGGLRGIASRIGSFFTGYRAIDVPYRRGQSPGSQRLGQSWTIASGGPLTVVVGNDATYGPLVQQRATQAAYHRGNWQTVEDVAEQEEAAVTRILMYAKGLG